MALPRTPSVSQHERGALQPVPRAEPARDPSGPFAAMAADDPVASRRAYAALARADGVLAGLIRRAGRPDPFQWTGQDRTGDDLFAGLALHLVGQQISVAAALAVYDRISMAAGGGPPTSGAVAGLGVDALRAAGLSSAKALALCHLARSADDGSLDLPGLAGAGDAVAVARLTALRGIGPWTAQMFLIHQLRRPDVLPAADIGLRVAVQRAWRLDARPTPDLMDARGRAWAPYRSYAAAVLWASLRA